MSKKTLIYADQNAEKTLISADKRIDSEKKLIRKRWIK